MEESEGVKIQRELKALEESFLRTSQTNFKKKEDIIRKQKKLLLKYMEYLGKLEDKIKEI